MKKQFLLLAAALCVLTFAHAQDSARALPSPLSSPPFPSSDWTGSPIIGEPSDAPDYPLQKALGLANDKSRIKIYGWVNPSFNWSSSKNSNVPMSYAVVPNHIELDQVVLRIERQPNTVQTDHFDWGFRLSNMYGIDYRYTTGKGYFSNQLLKHNNLYGYDPVEAYGLLYFPHVAQGLVVKVGRFISPPDIEAQLAPDNYMFTHSLMFTVDPYTFTGVQTTFKLSNYVQLEFGVHAGNDMAPWSNSAQVNGQALIRWTAKNNNNSLWGGINSLGAGKFKNEHDDLQQAVVTWGHRFSSKVHMMTEFYYQWQKDAAVGGTAIDGPAKSWFTNVGLGPIIPGISSSVGLVNYFQIQLSDKNYLSIRNDLLNDPQGQRTGFATAYTSHTVGYIQYLTKLIFIRPEVRYERAYKDGVTPYDDGTQKDQWTGSIDLIVRF
jgi:Putative beta-barrel porin-2, OmpL-like. bbp2